VFAVLKSRDVKFVFCPKCKLQLLKFELNLNFLCVLDPEDSEINFGAALGSMTGECSGLWLAKYEQIASPLPG